MRKLAGPALGAMLIAAQPALAESKPGAVFRDCADCPQMVVIPAGSFVMGSRVAEAVREGVPPELAARERPRHRVTLAKPFALGRFEVTRGEFAAFVRATGFRILGGCYYWTGTKWGELATRNWRKPGYRQSDRDPVVCVSWEEANAYVAWLGKKTGKPYRMPSEAEWEYAARAGTAGTWPWGGRRSDACKFANVSDLARAEAYKLRRTSANSFACRDNRVYTAPVGSFRPNRFGLHDMLGNVWEWSDDCWNKSYADAPGDGRVRKDGFCRLKVLRGGSWYSGPVYARAAMRYHHDGNGRMDSVGFRLARDLE